MKHFLITLFISCALPVVAQQRVVSEHHTPIEYVNIGVVGTNKGIISDEHGYFSLDKLQAAPTDSIYFSHISYKHKVIAYKDIKQRVELKEANIQLPTTTLKVKKPRIRNVKDKGISMPIHLYGGMKEYFSPSGHNGLNSEVGDFVSLKKDAQLTEFNLEVSKSSFYLVTVRVVVYQYKKEKDKHIFTPLLEKPIYIEIYPSEKKQTFTEKLSVFAPKGDIWVGYQFVEVRGKDDAEIYFNATSDKCYIRFADNKVEEVNLGAGIPFTIKGYDYEVISK
jgi:hypothetical protein